MNKTLYGITALFSFLFLCRQSSFAQESADDRLTDGTPPAFSDLERDLSHTSPGYFTVNPKSVSVKLLSVTDAPDMTYVRLKEEPPKDLNGVLVTVDSIVNVASKLWQIVHDNAAVPNIESKYATAYPQGVTSASQLTQWSRPKVYSYGFYAENLYGGVMIDCSYKVAFTYDGSYKGKGKFLTGVAVIPTVAQVAWGYNFSMTAAVPDSTITNVGTEADPVAALQLKLTWKMSTVLKEFDGTSVYYVQGDGYYKEIATPWKGEPKTIGSVKAALPLLDPLKVF